ncbi:MAG TPA: DUF5615 family PIN-like protein [Chitinophagaceae bacterium]|nr:DUF5615 family PIN-like protein [Chitinophagaceae bacterium]
MKAHFGFEQVKVKRGRAKLYADENIDSGLITSLKEEYKINIISAEELGFKGRDDAFQFQQAYKLNRFLLTCDWDFLNHKNFPFNQMIGVILLDIPKSFSEIGYIHHILTSEILPSGNEIEGTKVVIHKDSVEIYFISAKGKIEKQSFKYVWT